MKSRETQDFNSDHLKILLPTTEQKKIAVVITAILTAITRNTDGSAIFGAGWGIHALTRQDTI